MFVLGIDPGLTRCGFGLVEGRLDGPESFRAASAGVLATSPDDSVERRLAVLLGDLRSLLSELQPDAVVVERVFFQRNAKTAQGVAQASGVAIALAGDLGLPVRQFTAQEAKLAVTGYGAASKRQMQEMVATRCGLAAVPEPPDAADALGLALTFLLTARTEARYATGVTA
jgi:crossover junction endodeoxyribonuclease RuvC